MLLEIINFLSRWSIPLVVFTIPFYGVIKGVRVYEAFVEGAQEGFWVAVKVLPYVLAMFIALGIFRISGAFDYAITFLAPLLQRLGVPGEVLPLMLVRPFSGSGALAITAEIMHRYGPDSFLGRLASTLQGSTDTTFYVLTMYYGSVKVTRMRHTLPVALLGDLTGFIVATLATKLVSGHYW